MTYLRRYDLIHFPYSTRWRRTLRILFFKMLRVLIKLDQLSIGISFPHQTPPRLYGQDGELVAVSFAFFCAAPADPSADNASSWRS